MPHGGTDQPHENGTGCAYDCCRWALFSQETINLLTAPVEDPILNTEWYRSGTEEQHDDDAWYITGTTLDVDGGQSA
jgi:hypothetical protein